MVIPISPKDAADYGEGLIKDQVDHWHRQINTFLKNNWRKDIVRLEWKNPPTDLLAGSLVRILESYANSGWHITTLENPATWIFTTRERMNAIVEDMQS